MAELGEITYKSCCNTLHIYCRLNSSTRDI